MNSLLACMQSADRRRFLTHCEPVELRFGTVLFEPGDRIDDVYFPLDSYVSLLALTDRRNSLEVGLIGHEGMLGIGRILDIDEFSLRAVVAGSGAAMRMTASTFARELGRSGVLHGRLNRYLYALMAQFALSSACARYHDLPARLARWLLMTQDRARSDHFFFTHEFLANMLGVRRVGVTAAAGALQRDKLIRYQRGRIEVLNRPGLQKVACDCYRSLKDTYKRFVV